MNVQNISISDIIPYEHNAKKHSRDQVENIKQSIKQFGFRVPVLVDKNNVCIAGHGRLEAAKKLGMEAVPCVVVDDLTDNQIRALRLADNKTNESEWDLNALDFELTDLVYDTTLDMEDFGFTLDFENSGTTQELTEGGEINTENYRDETFNCECPRCGFKFNV